MFLTSRLREFCSASGRTGRVVTAAALEMAISLATLVRLHARVGLSEGPPPIPV